LTDELGLRDAAIERETNVVPLLLRVLRVGLVEPAAQQRGLRRRLVRVVEPLEVGDRGPLRIDLATQIARFGLVRVGRRREQAHAGNGQHR